MHDVNGSQCWGESVTCRWRSTWQHAHTGKVLMGFKRQSSLRPHQHVTTPPLLLPSNHVMAGAGRCTLTHTNPLTLSPAGNKSLPRPPWHDKSSQHLRPSLAVTPRLVLVPGTNNVTQISIITCHSLLPLDPAWLTSDEWWRWWLRGGVLSGLSCDHVSCCWLAVCLSPHWAPTSPWWRLMV